MKTNELKKVAALKRAFSDGFGHEMHIGAFDRLRLTSGICVSDCREKPGME
jgi:hypothetical protein